MAIHIIKLVVGVADMVHFAKVQAAYAVEYQGGLAIPVHTRNRPRREDEILTEGGSIYRVIKNRIQCRQEILGFEEYEDPEKGKRCKIMVSPEIIRTVSIARRPFQGWRYLKPFDAPADIGVYDPAHEPEAIPPEMEEELRESGLL